MSASTAPMRHRRVRTDQEKVKRLNYLFAFLTAGLLALAGVLRFVRIGDKPGIEWDEGVYASIGANEALRGVVEGKTEYYAAAEPYLYHPPFYFELLGQWFKWFGIGIPQARVLGAIGSLLMLAALAYLLKRVMGYWSLAVVALLSIDAWMVFTNRVSWIENTMMPIGVVALILYHQALCRANDKTRAAGWFFVGAGATFGAVVIYKHVGVIFILAAVITWLLLRRFGRQHLMMMAVFLSTLVAYVVGMTAVYGDDFWRQVEVQLRRSLGLRESRGALTSVSDIVGPLTAQYAIFVTSLALVAIAGGFIAYRVTKVLRRRSTWANPGEVLVFAWALAAMIFFAVLQLKLPHYFMMLQVPLYAYLVWEISQIFKNRQVGWRSHLAVVVVTLGAICGNSYAIVDRMSTAHGDALGEAAAWIENNLPEDAKVLTEESVGVLIDQPYCKMGKAYNCLDAPPAYIITYESYTQKVPDSDSVQGLLENAEEIISFEGYKEVITVYVIKTE